MQLRGSRRDVLATSLLVAEVHDRVCRAWNPTFLLVQGASSEYPRSDGGLTVADDGHHPFSPYRQEIRPGGAQ
jgi:hypothetical protein